MALRPVGRGGLRRLRSPRRTGGEWAVFRSALMTHFTQCIDSNSFQLFQTLIDYRIYHHSGKRTSIGLERAPGLCVPTGFAKQGFVWAAGFAGIVIAGQVTDDPNFGAAKLALGIVGGSTVSDNHTNIDPPGFG